MPSPDLKDQVYEILGLRISKDEEVTAFNLIIDQFGDDIAALQALIDGIREAIAELQAGGGGGGGAGLDDRGFPLVCSLASVDGQTQGDVITRRPFRKARDVPPEDITASYALKSDVPLPYLGNVGTRCMLRTTLGGASNAEQNCRMGDVAPYDIDGIQILTGHFRTFKATTDVKDTVITSAATEKWSIDFMGAVRRIMWNAGASDTCAFDANSSDLNAIRVSDLLPITIPKGKFYRRCLFRSSSGGLYTDHPGVRSSAAYVPGGSGRGDEYQEGVLGSMGDLTMPTTPGAPLTPLTSGAAVNRFISPLMVLTKMRTPSIMVLGSDNVFGSGQAAPDVTGNAGTFRWLASFYGYANLGAIGDLASSAANFAGSTSAARLRLALLPYVTDVVLSLGAGDLIAGLSAPAGTDVVGTIMANLVALAAQIQSLSPGTRVWLCPVSPQVTPADLTMPGPTDTLRVALNTLIRAYPALFSGVVDIVDLIEANASGTLKRDGGRYPSTSYVAPIDGFTLLEPALAAIAAGMSPSIFATR